MKLCFSSLGCPQDSVDELICRMKQLGVTGVELRTVSSTIDLWSLPDFSAEQLPMTKQKFADAGISVLVVGTSCSFADPAKKEGHMEKLLKYATIAQGLSCPYLRVFGGPIPQGMTREEVVSNDLSGYREALKSLEPYGVQVLFETHDDFSRSEWLLPLVQQLPGTGVIWDILHPYRFGEPMKETWENLKPYIRHVHIKDSLEFSEKAFDIAHIGEGNVPVSEALQILREGGYEGYLCYEWEKHWHPEIACAEEAFPRYMDYIKAASMSTGRTALVTGGSEGIGYACAQALLREGYRVCILGRSSEKLKKAQAALFRDGEIMTCMADVGNPSQVRDAVDLLCSAWGRIDVLINSAGCSMHAPHSFEDISSEDYLRIMHANADGVFWVTHAVLPVMKQQKSGFILNILSTAAHRPCPQNAPYSASKYAAMAITQTLVEECRGTGIRISSISPGPVATSIWGHKDNPPAEEIKARMLRPQDVAETAMFCISRPKNVRMGDIVIEPWLF